MYAIDFHTHLGTSKAAFAGNEKEKFLLDYCSTPRKLLESMKKNNIGKSVVFSVPMLSHEQKKANYEVLDMIKGNDRLIPFAYLDPRLKESPQLLEELVEKGCKGLKLHPVCHGYAVSNSLCYPTIEAAYSKKIPVLIHTGWGEYGKIRYVRNLAKEFKYLEIVIGHLVEYKDIIELIPPHRNVYVETSYSTHPERIRAAVRALGRDRVLFGSDFPDAKKQECELFKARNTPIRKLDMDCLLYENAERLLGLR